jgi:hypothetical protein
MALNEPNWKPSIKLYIVAYDDDDSNGVLEVLHLFKWLWLVWILSLPPRPQIFHHQGICTTKEWLARL